MPRDENIKRPSDWILDKHQADKHHSHGTSANFIPQCSECIHQQTIAQAEPNSGHHLADVQTANFCANPDYRHSGPDSQSCWTVPAPVSAVKYSEPPEVQLRRRVSADQIYAAHKEARMEARQALKEQVHTEGLFKSRKAVLPSEVRRREQSREDNHKGHQEGMDQRTYTPEHRGRSQRIKERGRELFTGHDSKDEEQTGSLQPSHTSERHQHGQYHYSEAPNLQYESTKQPYDDLRTQQVLRPHKNESQRQEPLSHRRVDLESQRRHQKPQIYSDFDQKQQWDPSVQQKDDSAVNPEKSSSLHQAKHRSMEMSGGPKHKTRTRSMSDICISQHSAMYQMERTAASRQPMRGSNLPGSANGDMGTVDTRVSVAQLRHSYLENANRKPDL